jgi:hypothetical protein
MRRVLLTAVLATVASCGGFREPYRALDGVQVDQGKVVGDFESATYSRGMWTISNDQGVLAEGECKRMHLAFALMQVEGRNVPVGTCYDPEPDAEIFVYDRAAGQVWHAEICRPNAAPAFWKENFPSYFKQDPHFNSYEDCGPGYRQVTTAS